MSDSVHQLEGVPAAQTLAPSLPSDDESLRRELVVARLPASAAAGASVNPQEKIPAAKPSHKPRRLIVGYFSTKKAGVDVPYLRVFGRWMRDAGFVIGRHVKIEVSEGRLVIEQVD